MTQPVALALYHRDHLSQGNARRTFGFEAFHWGILIGPEISKGQDCHTFEATDASEIDPVTFRMNNPTMDWWLRVTENVNLELSPKLIGRIVIGQTPRMVSIAELRDIFGQVPLPIRNTHPQQSCVTWAVNAVRAMQRQGWVRDLDLGQLKDEALSYADERMRGADSREPSVKYYIV